MMTSTAASAGGGSVQDRVTPYDAKFFAQYAPRTALDIVQRVPGFNFDQGNSDVRGFAGAAGNVVINGARPSSKAEGLATVLSRIPASSVIRVEVAPGDLYGSDYAGKSQVLNLVLSATGGTEGNVTLSANRLYTGYVNTDAKGSVQWKRGASTISLSGGTGRSRQVEEGHDYVDALPSGERIETRRKINSYFDKNPFISANWALERAPDKAIRANIRWQPSRFDLTQRNRVDTVGEPLHDDSLVQHYKLPVFEIGGDITRPLAGGAIKLVALATRRKKDNFDAYLGRDGLLSDDPAVIGGFEQRQKAKLDETIGKLNWSRADLAGFTVEVGAEAALNKLDNQTRLSVIEEDGTRVPVALPIANAVVKEKRGQLTFNAGHNLSPTVRIDGGIAYEFSHLTVTGDTEASRTLRFWKPTLNLDWQPKGGWHARLSARRTVAQLNFYDFISVAELSTDRVNAGNADLRPQRTWEFRALLEKSVLGDGQLRIEAAYDRVSALQDQILTPDGFSVPGNLGTGTRRGISAQLDTPLDKLGLKGVRVKLNGQVQKTRVHDPISGRVRRWSDYWPEWEVGMELRRDVGPWSYGVSVNDRDSFYFYRADETDRNFNDKPYGTAFVEWRPSARTSLTLDIDNAFDTAGGRERLFFLPNRSVENPAFRERRIRNRHVSFGLTLKQSFGGGGAKS
ncbi:TonB-dependent receptor domain-containing protein [Sphingomonas astaxanthinifaciens]|uniref:TonB-dependent receptor n=1 Tax=Sphingomonas astaxanthinifaciens DSM 22298 TaxID=1123267 RepID=A0ABQ5Z8B5_9SPHN|nr:TonB-dependent receptor [Sphingomonas astaxanthinifaciens]GLR47716.1 TonB-dependent receptor [Sphingomonas astaxanthinifaciens DSM 22298]